MNSNKQNLINKIIYRSQYRGTKEMDIFVSSFVKSIIDSLSFDDLVDLDKLVNMSDEDIIKISKKKMIFKNNQILNYTSKVELVNEHHSINFLIIDEKHIELIKNAIKPNRAYLL